MFFEISNVFLVSFSELNEKNSSTINPITQQAAESILHYMSKWLINDKRVRIDRFGLSTSLFFSFRRYFQYQIRNRQIIPRGFNCEKLLKDLFRELDVAKVMKTLKTFEKKNIEYFLHFV